MSYDLIALGETMLALSPPAGETLQRAASLVVDHAGAESNTCVGLARLGFQVAWVSRLGEDPPGDRILEALRSEGIDTRFVRRDPRRQTGVMFKDPVAQRVRYYRAGSAASALDPEDIAGLPLAEARAVLVTGVTALLGPGPQATALALLGAAASLRVVDPNLRRGLPGSDRWKELVLPLFERADLVLSGEQELAELLGPGDPQDLARRCARRGPREVVVRGTHRLGALQADGAWVEADIQRSDAVDAVGAGDAFNAGYLAVRLRGGPVPDALRAGIHCGTAVAMSLGDTAGFPHTLADTVAPQGAHHITNER
ncbi:MAG TPA: sugar kinase [Vicinamibacteria bacterium]